ncbi:MAG: glycosyltransferase [Flavobacteriaceae bacterium]
MKVVHCIGSFNFGGIERLVYDLAKLQLERDSLYIAISARNFKGEFKEDFEGLGIDLINFNLNSGFDLSPIKIKRIEKQFNNFDVIHLHGFNLTTSIAAILSRKKIVYTEHGNFAFGRKITWSDKLSFWLRKIFFKYTKTTICSNSEFTRNYVIEKFYQGSRLCLVYNGISLDYLINVSLQQKLKEKYADKFVIGTSSRLAGFKRVDRLISVFKEYLKINTDSVLLIVGDGIEREKLEKQVKDLKIEEQVDFVGYQKEVATYQSVFDVCVFPSTSEPFGLVAVECYSKKKPVLVFGDGGGITEVVQRFEEKDVCSDAKTMIDRLNYYAKNNFKWKSCHDNELEFFSLKRMEQDYYIQYNNKNEES